MRELPARVQTHLQTHLQTSFTGRQRVVAGEQLDKASAHLPGRIYILMRLKQDYQTYASVTSARCHTHAHPHEAAGAPNAPPTTYKHVLILIRLATLQLGQRHPLNSVVLIATHRVVAQTPTSRQQK